MRLTYLMVVPLYFACTVLAADNACPGASGAQRTECLTKALKVSEGELKRKFAQVIAGINSKDNEFIPKPERDKWKAAAERAQSAWMTYRDTECQTVIYSWWGGSGAGGATVECLLLKTQSRTKELGG